MQKFIHTKEEKGILIIQFNRPEKLNAITKIMYAELNEAFHTLNTRDDLRVGIICGAGNNFTAGNDLRDFLSAKKPEDLKDVTVFIQTLGQVKKVLIAAVDGAAIGIGATILPYCDLVYASNTAYLQTPFVNLGLCPESGSTLLFPKVMGHQRASEFFFLGEKISAHQAQAMGLVNQIISDKPVLDYALEKAKIIAKKSSNALLVTKQLLRASESTALEAVVQQENMAFQNLLSSQSTIATMQAFFKIS